MNDLMFLILKRVFEILSSYCILNLSKEAVSPEVTVVNIVSKYALHT